LFGRLLIVCLFCALIAGGATASAAPQDPTPAAPPDTTAPAEPAVAAEPAPDTTIAEPEPVEIVSTGAGIVIYGTATLSNGYPLAEVTATLFVGGLEEESATTDTSGVYTMRHAIDPAADETVVLWFTPPRGMGLVREIFVLKESRAARETRQFGPCMERIQIADSTLVDIVVLNQQEYATKLEESGCMDIVVELGVEYDFSYNLASGDAFTMTTTSTGRITRTFGNEEMAVNTNSAATFAAVVDSVGEDGMALELTYQSREFSTDSPEVRGSVDFTPLIGQKVNVNLSSIGEVSRFNGFEALPGIEVGPNETLDRDAYVNELKNLLPRLSGGPVAEGGSWTDEYSIRESGEQGGVTTIAVSTTYTVVGETTLGATPCLEIDFESTVSVNGTGTTRGVPFTMEMAGEGSGKIYFDHERGMLLEQSSTVRVEGAIESSVMTIPIVNEAETKLEVALQ
jgi:hypothetical protein